MREFLRKLSVVIEDLSEHLAKRYKMFRRNLLK